MIARSAVRAASLGVLAAILLVGCAGGGGEGASGGLVGTSWVVTELAGTATIERSRPTMVFGEDGRVTGTDGCNRYSMAFRTDGDRIELTDAVGTDSACGPEVMAQADAFRQALAGADRWRQSETGTLQFGQGDLVAAPADAAGPATAGAPGADELADTSWVLIDLGGSSDLLGTVITLEFAGDGTLGGSGGCNTYSGPYAVTGMGISIGPLVTTKMACPPPAADIEPTFLGALDAAGQWSIDDAGHLVLAGPTPLTFEPG